MRQRGWMTVATVILMSLFTTCAIAAGGTGGISFSAAVVPIGSGDAGDSIRWVGGAPKQDDAFDTGWGLRVEPYYDFTSLIRGQFGFAYNSWSGKNYGGVNFDDLKMITYYIGVKIRFLPNSKIRPYVVADIGGASISGVKVSGPGVPGGQTQYWDSTNTLFLDIGGGVEFNVAPKVSLFIDIRAQGTGEPKSAASPASDSDGITSFPISAGVNITF